MGVSQGHIFEGFALRVSLKTAESRVWRGFRRVRVIALFAGVGERSVEVQ